MFEVCQRSKYGFCKFGKKCDKIHFSDICEDNDRCTEKYCDKRHPIRCFFFDTYGRCKFGTFCSYLYEENIEIQLRKEIAKLRAEIDKLKRKNKETSKMLERTSKSYQHSIENKEFREIPNSDKTTINSSDLINVSLQTLIRESSGYQCDLCDLKQKRKKD